jgi:Centromere-binding protein ParB C-terminal
MTTRPDHRARTYLAGPARAQVAADGATDGAANVAGALLRSDGGDARPATSLGRRRPTNHAATGLAPAAPEQQSRGRRGAVSLGVSPGDPRWGRGRSTRSSGYRSRTYYLPDDLHFRMRNAWWHTQAEAGGHDSMSELVTTALLPAVEELEARYNGGRPFPEIPDRQRPTMGPSGRARQARAMRLRAAARRSGRDDVVAEAGETISRSQER